MKPMAEGLISAAYRLIGIPYDTTDCRAFVEERLREIGAYKNLPGEQFVVQSDGLDRHAGRMPAEIRQDPCGSISLHPEDRQRRTVEIQGRRNMERGPYRDLHGLKKAKELYTAANQKAGFARARSAASRSMADGIGWGCGQKNWIM